MKYVSLMDVVILTKVKKQLKKLPSWIKDKLEGWVALVQSDGVRAVRKKKGYHDEP